jgi:hypothetical protein
MLDVKQTANGIIRALKLNRETLRELDAGQAQGGRQTFYCFTDFRCTQGCGPITKKCGTQRDC